MPAAVDRHAMADLLDAIEALVRDFMDAIDRVTPDAVSDALPSEYDGVLAFSIADVSKLLGASYNTINSEIHAGRIDRVANTGRRVFIPRREVVRMLGTKSAPAKSRGTKPEAILS